MNDETLTTADILDHLAKTTKSVDRSRTTIKSLRGKMRRMVATIEKQADEIDRLDAEVSANRDLTLRLNRELNAQAIAEREARDKEYRRNESLRKNERK